MPNKICWMCGNSRTAEAYDRAIEDGYICTKCFDQAVVIDQALINAKLDPPYEV